MNDKTEEAAKPKKLKKGVVSKAAILEAALAVAVREGFNKIRQLNVAQEAGFSGPAVQHHFGTMAKMRKEVMRYAVKKECLPVIAQGLSMGDAQANKAGPDLKKRALQQLAGL